MKATSRLREILFHGLGWARSTWVKAQVCLRDGWQKSPLVQNIKHNHLPEMLGIVWVVPAGAARCHVLSMSGRLAVPLMPVHHSMGTIALDLPDCGTLAPLPCLSDVSAGSGGGRGGGWGGSCGGCHCPQVADTAVPPAADTSESSTQQVMYISKSSYMLKTF